MKREDLQEILASYRKEHGCQELLWAVYDDILFPVKRREKFFRMEQIMAQGDFRGTFDYDTGFLVVTITVYCYDYSETPARYNVDIHITNIDDGSWRAVSSIFTDLEMANKLAEDVSFAFFKEYKRKLPTEEELNEFLRSFGMWGHSEG